MREEAEEVEEILTVYSGGGARAQAAQQGRDKTQPHRLVRIAAKTQTHGTAIGS